MKLIKEERRGVVSKETVVLRRWGSSMQKFGFINGVDNVNWYRTEILKADVSSVHQRRQNCRSLIVIASDLKDKTIGGGRFLLSDRWDY